jgi:hypothetical protein
MITAYGRNHCRQRRPLNTAGSELTGRHRPNDEDFTTVNADDISSPSSSLSAHGASLRLDSSQVNIRLRTKAEPLLAPIYEFTARLLVLQSLQPLLALLLRNPLVHLTSLVFSMVRQIFLRACDLTKFNEYLIARCTPHRPGRNRLGRGRTSNLCPRRAPRANSAAAASTRSVPESLIVHIDKLARPERFELPTPRFVV